MQIFGLSIFTCFCWITVTKFYPKPYMCLTNSLKLAEKFYLKNCRFFNFTSHKIQISTALTMVLHRIPSELRFLGACMCITWVSRVIRFTKAIVPRYYQYIAFFNSLAVLVLIHAIFFDERGRNFAINFNSQVLMCCLGITSRLIVRLNWRSEIG